MVDSTHLDFIRTFLGKIHTAATVNHYTENRKIEEIDDTSRMLVFPPEIIGTTDFYTNERFKVTLYEESEALLITAISNIVTGCWKLNTRQTITSYTRPAAFIHCEFKYSNKTFISTENYFWIDINLDCKFTV